MAVHAIENLDDALEASRALLWPVRAWRWLKLAVVAVFISTGTHVSTPGFDFDSIRRDPGAGLPIGLPAEALAIMGIVIVGAIVVGLIWWFISAIMEFVFIESLRNEAVELRTYWGRRWRQGVWLFLFRLALVIPVVLVVLGWAILVFGPLVTETLPVALPLALLVLGFPVVFAVGLVFGVVYGFTTVFVVPIMIKDDCGVLAGWRQLWPSVTREWKQYLAYAVAAVLLAFGLGLVAALVLTLAAVLLVIPVAGIGLLVFVLSQVLGPVAWLLLGVAVMAFLLMMTVIWALVQVPILTYMRYYALLVLGDIEASFDLIPDRREAIRSDA